MDHGPTNATEAPDQQPGDDAGPAADTGTETDATRPDAETPRVDLLTHTFLTMEQFGPDPTDLYFGIVLRCTGPVPSLADLRARVAERIGLIPSLTHRLVDGPKWEPDPDFDVAAHIDVLPDAPVTAVPAKDWLGSAPERDRPLWRMWLLPGDGTDWALVTVVHHAAQDASALLRTLEVLFGDAPPPPPTSRAARPWAAMRTLPNVLSTLPAAPNLAVMGELTGQRRLRHVSVPFADLRRIAEASGTTVGQVHVAALAGAVRRWSPSDYESGGRDIPIVFPVDTRTQEERGSTEGSRVGLLRVVLPTTAGTPAERLRAATKRLSRKRTTTARTATRSLLEDVPPRWSGPALKRLAGRRASVFNTSIIRPLGTLDVLGGTVEEVVCVPWMPLEHGCFTVLASTTEQATFSVLTDTGVDDSRDLAACWAAEVAELTAAVDKS